MRCVSRLVQMWQYISRLFLKVVYMGIASVTRTVKFAPKSEPGKRGQLPFPAGEYSMTMTYLCTDLIAPYVLYNGMYYVMNQVTSWVGQGMPSNLNTPQKDYAVNGTKATWIPFENFKAIYIEILMAQFAKLASAVFYEEFMFSQQGKDTNGNETSNYEGFSRNEFAPNLLLDFLRGKIKCNSVDVNGSIITPYIRIDLEPNETTVCSLSGRTNAYIYCKGSSVNNHTLCMPLATQVEAGTEVNLFYFVAAGRLAPRPVIKIYPDGEFLPNNVTEISMSETMELQLKVVKIGPDENDKRWFVVNG